MVDSSYSLHSNSVISEDKPSDISNSSYSDFVKRSPSLPTMVSGSSTQEDKPSDSMANSHSVPPMKPTESPPETFKPDSTKVTESNPVEAPAQPEPSAEPQPDPAPEPSPEPTNTVTDSAPVVDNDPTEPPMTDGPIIEEVKTTLMDEITTRISLSTSAPLPNPPVPIRITHQIGTTLKDEISTTISSSTGDDSSSSSTILIVVILAIVIALIVIIIFFVCKRYRKKKGQTKGGKGKKLKQTNVKVTKKKADDGNSKASAKTAKSISGMKKDGKGIKGKNIDKSKTGSSSSKSTKSGKNPIVIPSLEVDSTLESGSSSPAKIEAEQSVFVCYDNQWRQVRQVDSDFSFSIASQ